MKKDKLKKISKILLLILPLLLMLSISLQSFSTEDTRYINKKDINYLNKIPYTQFLEDVKNNQIYAIWYGDSKSYITILYKGDYIEEITTENIDLEDVNIENNENTYIFPEENYKATAYPDYSDFKKEMLEYGINVYEVRKSSTLISALISNFFLLFLIGMLGFYMFSMAKATSGKTGGTGQEVEKSNVKFKDVIGQDEILEDVKFISELIKNPDTGDKLGVKVPRGILLTGQPGVGKTLIAKAIAGEADVPFISVSGSDFKELFVGMGARRVRSLFESARKKAPCVVFIDEIDAVGGDRANSLGNNSEDSQTIDALLKEMDGFTSRDGVFVIAATNYPDKLDRALTRAGRFDRQINVMPPKDADVRKDLFNLYTKNMKLSDDVDIKEIAEQTAGFTGADISAVCNEAGIIALMNKKEYVDNACFEEAIDKKIFNGNRTKKEEDNGDKEIVAYHEAGHAVMSYLRGLPLARASIMPMTSGVGGVVFEKEPKSGLHTKKYYEDRIMVCYAGRASEQIKFNEITTGASNDITQATGILNDYISRLGFHQDFGLLDMNLLSRNKMISEDSTFEYMQSMSKSFYEDTVKLLSENYELVEKIATALLENRILDSKKLYEILDGETNNADNTDEAV